MNTLYVQAVHYHSTHSQLYSACSTRKHLQVGCISLISCALMAAQQVMGPVSLAPSMAAFEGLQP
jgi:hypothetical protein